MSQMEQRQHTRERKPREQEIGIRDVYQELRRTNERLRAVEIHLAAHRAEHKSLTAYKAMLYPTMVGVAGALAGILIK